MGIDREEIRDDMRQATTADGGEQQGGGPVQSDMGAGGGSSSGGGYRHAQNQQNHQGQDLPGYGSSPGYDSGPDQSRGEAFDEAQGGGRGPGSVSDDDDLAKDQQEHQDRGQRWLDEEQDKSGGG